MEDNEPRCRCPDAFSGRVCDTDKCLNVTCENSGTCENGICICQPGEIRTLVFVICIIPL